ncbi:uncharacterized protein C3orf67 homolog isoform X1 [Xiphias gladius]|uniref:uncharacterized protein C3orf67 homolog isoform X1 n=1 Tax=Xiphias gladius TaxID=8245 RepID=UPI001A98F8DE|nr:uncharacterized protein C3orf67 homolog isoform X1 [Xiphias gladius]
MYYFFSQEYDKEVKGFVYCLEGSSQTVKMQMPENGKMSLGLLQRFLVLQVNIPQCKDFSIELMITDSEHLKRRLHLSTVHKELTATLLHAKIPFVGLKRNIWSTLYIDVVSFTAELFKGFLTLDGITLFATCKVRRIFTMKTEPTGMSEDDMFLSGAGIMDLIPRSCKFPPDVNHVTQMLNMENMQKADMRTGLVNSYCGTLGRLQPHPPTDKQGSKKVRVLSARRESLASSAHSDAVPGQHRQRSKTRERCTLPSSRQEGRRRPLTLTEKTEHLTADECCFSPGKESSRAAPTPAESLSCSIRPGLSSDLQVWEGNEGSEPRLTLEEEVFIFSSQPHSPKRGQGQGDQEKMEMGDDQVHSKSGRRYEAQPEDDFIGSESDEDKSYTTFQQQRTIVESNPAAPRTPDPNLDVQIKVHSKSQTMEKTSPQELSPAATNIDTQSPSSGRAELAGMVPTHCLSPSATPSRQEHKCGPCESEEVNQVLDGNSSVTLSRRLLQEFKLDDSPQRKEADETLKPVDSSHYNLQLLGSPRMHGDDDEELKMLASLKREQEEDEYRASGLSGSQIHQCNVSISMSSDDTSTWTHISM